MPLEVQGHTVPHLKALRYGKHQTRGLSCGSTLSILQDVLKVAIYYINGALFILKLTPLHCKLLCVIGNTYRKINGCCSLENVHSISLKNTQGLLCY